MPMTLCLSTPHTSLHRPPSQGELQVSCHQCPGCEREGGESSWLVSLCAQQINPVLTPLLSTVQFGHFTEAHMEISDPVSLVSFSLEQFLSLPSTITTLIPVRLLANCFVECYLNEGLPSVFRVGLDAASPVGMLLKGSCSSPVAPYQVPRF